MKLDPKLLILSLLAFYACNTSRTIEFPTTDLTQVHIIPQPIQMMATGEGFALDRYTSVTVPNNEAWKKAGQYLIDKIQFKTGLDLSETSKSYTSIVLIQDESINDEESYQIAISRDSLVLRAKDAEAAFRGIQTIRQVIPETSNDSIAKNPIWVIPTGVIKDKPQYEHRGTMLDMARHFFSVQDVKKYLDILAYYKINVFHMHLTDDQGWRIEIKSWPRLTEVGSLTGVGGGPGGFYTQEDYKEIVAYAAARHIMVIPEVDMPGHTNSASLAYNFLNGNGKEIKQVTDMAVGYSTFDTRKDSVYQFIDDVIREISAITPGPYFHIGGDESHVTEKEDYIYFVDRVEKIVQKYGKRLIGWDEVATANLSPNSVAQIWNSQKNKALAIDKDMKIILSPANKAYLDMKYDEESEYGLKWAGLIPVDTAYLWNPESYAPNEHVLGVEAPLWSETIRTIDELEYLAFPRIIGYAELAWSTRENRNWEDYKKRLAHHGKFLRRNRVSYYPSKRIDWQ